jgi:hypothetical protein
VTDAVRPVHRADHRDGGDHAAIALYAIEEPGFRQGEHCGGSKDPVCPGGREDVAGVFRQELARRAGRSRALRRRIRELGIGKVRTGRAVDMSGRILCRLQVWCRCQLPPGPGDAFAGGKEFRSPAVAADTIRSVVINETMMKRAGLDGHHTAIGQQADEGMHSGDTATPPVVIGVVKDINFMSMSGAVEPQTVSCNYGMADPRRFLCAAQAAVSHRPRWPRSPPPGGMWRPIISSSDNFLDGLLSTGPRRSVFASCWALRWSASFRLSAGILYGWCLWLF